MKIMYKGVLYVQLVVLVIKPSAFLCSCCHHQILRSYYCNNFISVDFSVQFAT